MDKNMTLLQRFLDCFAMWVLGFCEIIDGMIRVVTLGFWCPEVAAIWLQAWVGIQSNRKQR